MIIMAQSFEEAKKSLLSSGKPGKLIRLDDGTWSVLPLPDKDPVMEKRKQEKELLKASQEAIRVQQEEEQLRKNEATRERFRQMEIEQKAKREQEARMLLLRKEWEAERMLRLEQQMIKQAEKLEALRRDRLQEASKKLMDSPSRSLTYLSSNLASRKNANFSDSYRATIEESLRRFVNNGDDVACTGVYIYEYGRCELCGHQQIKWHYILENLSSHGQMVVGSECIRNYKIILEEWGYRPAYVVFPQCLKQFTRWILEQDSGAIRFGDAVACFYTKDPRNIYSHIRADKELKMFTFAKKVEGSLVASDATMDEHVSIP